MTPEAAARAEAAVSAALAADRYDDAEQLAVAYIAGAGPIQDTTDPASDLGFRAAYLAGRVAADAGQLTIASARLAPLAGLSARLPAALAARLYLLLAEVDGRRGRHRDARDWLARIPDATILADPVWQLRALRVELWGGRHADFAHQLDALAETFLANSDAVHRTLLLVERGRAYETEGNRTAAAELWRQAEDTSRGLGPDPVRSDARMQLGRLAHLQGDLPGALHWLDTAREGATPPQRVEIEVRSALVALDLGRTTFVTAVAERLHTLPHERLPDEVRPIVAVFLAVSGVRSPPLVAAEIQGYRAARAGDMRRARDLYHEALATADGHERRARLTLGLGELAVAAGDWSDARAWLGQAVALASDFPEVLARGLEGLGRVAAECDRDEVVARDYFERAVTIVRHQAERFAHRTDAAAYRERHLDPLRQLLRSAARRDDPVAVFALQELERGRLLLDLWHASGRTPADDVSPSPTLPADSIRDSLARAGDTRAPSVSREHELESYLRDRSRRGSAAIPALPDLAELRQSLPCGTLYLAPTVLTEDVILIAVSRDHPTRLFHAGEADRLREQALHFRRLITTQTEQYESGFAGGTPDRPELDAALDQLGSGPIGRVVGEALAAFQPRGVVWVPSDPLHTIPMAAVRLGGRYLVERVPWMTTFGGGLYVHQRRTRRHRRGWWRSPLVVAEAPEVLAGAAEEGRAVAGLFHRTRQLNGPAASRAAVRTRLASARFAHFACHAYADPECPLASAVGLPGGEHIRAADWLDEPVAGLGLVTLSACRSAAVGAVAGAEVFGPAVGLLAAGVRAVLASLWKVADAETLPLMAAFYRHRRRHDLATALALAQREGIVAPGGSPLFWAAFAVYGDADGLATPLQAVRGWFTGV